MSDYSQTRSFNLGVAQDTGSIGAALVYDDLVYAQKVFGKGYFYRSYEQMSKRFPMWTERTIRTYIRKLEERGWISTKVMKQNGNPVCHYQICRFLSAKISETMESEKISETINNKTTKKETKNDALLLDLISLVNPKEKPTAERARALNARLKDYTADEIRGAARAFSKSDWHRQNKQMSIDNLLAPSKFGRWYAARDTSAAATAPDQIHEEDVTVTNQDEMVRRRMGDDDGPQ